MSSVMKLSAPQLAVLEFTSKKRYVRFLDALRVGANGATLSSLCKKGLLEKTSYPDGSNDWQITDAGRKAVGEESA